MDNFVKDVLVPNGPSFLFLQPWTDSEIRIFMQEWKVVEWITGHPGRKIYQKSWALYQRLNGHRGLKKSWESCVDLLLTLQNWHRRLCNVKGDTIPLFSPYSEDLYSILCCSPCPFCRHPWPDYEIRIFMQEWQVVERITGHPGRKICQKSWALYQRLNGYWNLKSWESCVDLLLTLQNRHSRLCNGRGDTISLFSPYSEDLSSILGHSPCSLYREELDNHLPPENPQPSMDWPGDHGIPVSSAQHQGNPLPMISQEDSLFGRLETQNYCCPSSVPHLLPDSDSGTFEDVVTVLELETMLQFAEVMGIQHLEMWKEVSRVDSSCKRLNPESIPGQEAEILDA
ncbi:uncharacterized protein LOC143274507 [Peromyscus maniculatus bairdii]|uniref:uncharacterized protein LOC143274507 n=1 Tax=Peromyscus maniculatus bairdii TaxID=230844 RepID=UPI003FCF4B9C